MNIAISRCPECKKENYAMNVLSGQCTWCGYKATEKDIDGENVWKVKEE